ncbi:MAG TPA: PIN domain-containing protein [Candidatus Dormibacteraeota bacterium]
MTVLADTSVWVDFLKIGSCGPAADLALLLRDRDVVLCGQVVGELLAGTRPEKREGLWTLLSGLPWLELRARGWRRVGELAGDARRRGYTLPLTDVQIAVLALENQARLWSRDAHFAQLGILEPALLR